MAKVVVENGNEVKNEEVLPMVVCGTEMVRIVRQLSDWGKEVRKMMRKKYKGYKYWKDGARVDGDFYMMKKDGDRQWFLDFFHYRICGKGKRTQFRVVLRQAAFVDSKGRYGYYEKEGYNGYKMVEGYEVVYRVEKAGGLISPEKCDVAEWLKYSNIENYFEESLSGRTGRIIEEAVNYARLYVEYPQIEFIYRLDNKDIKNSLLSKLYVYKYWEKNDELKEFINIIRICLKHKFHLFRPRRKCKEINTAYKINLWWDYVEGLKALGKDCRNPHYLCPKNITDAHDKVMIELRKRMPLEVDPMDQIKFDRLKKRFVGMAFEEDDLVIMALDSPKAYIEESREMHNCIESLKYYIKPSSLILCARLKGKRIADIELSLNTYEIIQCCGPCNRIVPERNRIEELIKKNLPEIQARQHPRKYKIIAEDAA